MKSAIHVAEQFDHDPKYSNWRYDWDELVSFIGQIQQDAYASAIKDAAACDKSHFGAGGIDNGADIADAILALTPKSE